MKRSRKKQWTAADMGKKGGKKKSPAKSAAARENGKRGGRPRKHTAEFYAELEGDSAPLAGAPRHFKKPARAPRKEG